MKKWLLGTLLLAGCSSGGSQATFSEQGSENGVAGILARSPSGALEVLDAPLPAGFVPVAGAEVQVVGSLSRGRTATDGSFFVASQAGSQRLWVDAGQQKVVLTAPAFSASAGSPVRLQLFPERLQVRDLDTLAFRAVGVDGRGRFLRLDPAQVVWSQADAPLPLRVPQTSEGDLSQPISQTDINSLGAADPQSTVVSQGVGNFEVRAQLGGLSQSADWYSVSPACLASLSGQVTFQGAPLVGALVAVDGFPECRQTDSQGRYTFEGLAPVPSQVHVFHRGLQVGLGFAPLVARHLTRLDLPTRPLSYQLGASLPIQASGLGTRPNGDVFVSDGQTVRRFSGSGQEVLPAPVAPPGHPFSRPQGLAVDFSGQAYVANSGSQQVLFLSTPGVSLASVPLQTIAVDGGANLYALGAGLQFFANQGAASWSAAASLAQALLDQPKGVAVGRDGRIYVADSGHNRIAVLELTEGSPARLLRGDPGSNLAQIQARLVEAWSVSSPQGVALGPAGEVYVANAQGVSSWTPGGHDPISVTSSPALGALAADGSGRLWVAEKGAVQQYRGTSPSVIAASQPAPSGQVLRQDSSLENLEQSLLSTLRNFEIPGASLAVSANGRLVLRRGYGFSKLALDEQVPTSPEQRFRLASCSKTVTGACLLLQMQDHPGRIGLGTRPFQAGGLLAGGVAGYGLTSQGLRDARMSSITVANLLRMTAGLDTPTALYSPFQRTLAGGAPPASAIETALFTFRNFALGSNPGDRYVYSDIAYLTLGRLVEAVARAEGLAANTYDAYAQQRLLAPLGITVMQIADTRLGQTAPGEVQYYPYSGESCGQSVFTNAPAQVPSTYGAIYDGRSHDSTGGWMANCSDLVRLANALAPDQTPPGFSNPLDATRQADFKLRANAAGDSAAGYFGCGWNLVADSQGVVTRMFKDGALSGTSTYVAYLRQGSDQVCYCFLMNSRPGPGSKKNLDAKRQVEQAVERWISEQAGRWPAGNLF